MGYENQVITVLTLKARTATPTLIFNDGNYALGYDVGPDQLNRGNAAGIIILNVATAPGGASVLNLSVDGVDRSMENYNAKNGTAYPTTWNIGSSDSITSTGVYVFRVHPAFVAVPQSVFQDILPRFWRVTVTHGDTSSWIYSLSYQLVEA